jgi:uncharacterized membrane protein
VSAQEDTVPRDLRTHIDPATQVGSLSVAHVRRVLERARDLERFLTYIDAIVAIAVTLLVLPLVEVAGDVTEMSINELVNDHQGQIFSFFLSFFVITQSWFAQHHIVRTLVVQDKVVTRCLMLWALTIVVLPVPTALVSGSHEGDKTEVLYIGTMALSSLALSVAAWRVATTPAIRDDGDPPSVVDSVTILVIMVLALVASLIIPGAGYLPLLFLLLSGRVSAVVRARRRRRAQHPTPLEDDIAG